MSSSSLLFCNVYDCKVFKLRRWSQEWRTNVASKRGSGKRNLGMWKLSIRLWRGGVALRLTTVKIHAGGLLGVVKGFVAHIAANNFIVGFERITTFVTVLGFIPGVGKIFAHQIECSIKIRDT